MDPWGWAFLIAGLVVMLLSIPAGRWSVAASTILFLTCVASNLRHVYLDRIEPQTVYALIDLVGGLAMIQVYHRVPRHKRRWLAGILALFGVMMALHLAVWFAAVFGPAAGRVWVYRFALSVLFGCQYILAVIPGGHRAYLNLRSILRGGPHARAVQA